MSLFEEYRQQWISKGEKNCSHGSKRGRLAYISLCREVKMEIPVSALGGRMCLFSGQRRSYPRRTSESSQVSRCCRWHVMVSPQACELSLGKSSDRRESQAGGLPYVSNKVSVLFRYFAVGFRAYLVFTDHLCQHHRHGHGCHRRTRAGRDHHGHAWRNQYQNQRHF